MEKWWRYLLFIGQCLIWASMSFLLCWYFFWTGANQSTLHHDHQDHLVEKKRQSTRENTSVDQATLHQELENLVQESILNNQEHAAASLDESTAQRKYNELCSVYDDVCTMTSWQWSFWWVDKYLYQALWIALVQNLDDRLIANKTLSQTLSSLLIYQSKTDARWSAWHTTVKINNHSIPTLREYREVLTHEFWHTIDLWAVHWSATKKHSWFTEFWKTMRSTDDPSIAFYEISWLNENTRKRNASFKDFVSGYGMKNIYEDFAECNNLRINHNLLFQALAENNEILAQKYAYFQDLYNNERFDDNADSATTASTTKRPWDTTRIR